MCAIVLYSVFVQRNPGDASIHEAPKKRPCSSVIIQSTCTRSWDRELGPRLLLGLDFCFFARLGACGTPASAKRLLRLAPPVPPWGTGKPATVAAGTTAEGTTVAGGERLVASMSITSSTAIAASAMMTMGQMSIPVLGAAVALGVGAGVGAAAAGVVAGVAVGALVGLGVGALVGLGVGALVGLGVGAGVGECVGAGVGGSGRSKSPHGTSHVLELLALF